MICNHFLCNEIPSMVGSLTYTVLTPCLHKHYISTQVDEYLTVPLQWCALIVGWNELYLEYCTLSQNYWQLSTHATQPSIISKFPENYVMHTWGKIPGSLHLFILQAGKLCRPGNELSSTKTINFPSSEYALVSMQNALIKVLAQYIRATQVLSNMALALSLVMP